MLAEKSTKPHARRKLAHLALCKDCSQRCLHRHVMERRDSQRVGVSGSFPQCIGFYHVAQDCSQSSHSLQVQEKCRLVSKGLWWPVQITQHLLGCNSCGDMLGLHTETTCSGEYVWFRWSTRKLILAQMWNLSQQTICLIKSSGRGEHLLGTKQHLYFVVLVKSRG